MWKTVILSAVIVASVAAVHPVFPHSAAPMVAGNNTMTLAEFVETALVSSPDLVRSSISLKEAEASLAAFGSKTQPELTLNFGYHYMPNWPVPGGWAAEVGITGSSLGAEYRFNVDFKGKAARFQLAHPLFASAKLSPYRQKAISSEYTYKQELILHQITLEEVFLNAVQCFLNIWRLQKEVEIRQKLAAWLGCQVEIMAAAFGSGMIHQLDLALAQLQYEIHVNALEKVKGQLVFEQARAVQDYGISPETELIHEAEEFKVELLERFLKPQPAPAVAMAHLNLELANLDVEKTKAALGIHGELRVGINSDRSWLVECAIRIPLVDSTVYSKQMEAAGARLEQAELEVERAKAENDCEQIYRQALLRAAAANLNTAVKARELAARKQQIAQEQYALGLISFLELLEVCEEEADALLSMIHAQYEHQLALIQCWFLERSREYD
ncbi:MAG TPA: TolC family protein [Limnochordia bacterium]|nr:TolC family protein [Limnochordia bacterium]HXK96687.1 TolC family protein [Limnochordia bacterium]